MQPYVAVGQYQAFKELAKPKTYIFYPYFFKNPDFDFNKKTLKSNAVLRWEYMPGSTLYLVWTQSRKDELYAGDFDFSRDFRRTFIGGGKNIFMLKLNYWLNL
jgi:hypothetical protein